MLKVIIADDERLICRLVQALGDWEALDMEVAGLAENGLEALALIERERPDILITDIRMPGMNGLDLLKHIKILAPETEVILISGHADLEMAFRGSSWKRPTSSPNPSTTICCTFP